jgi:DhnA family fructose-bisphosphate aldolase class Ia
MKANMHPGKSIRLQKFWKHRRTMIIPFDHGSYAGPSRGIEDPVRLTERIAKTSADGILVTPGVLKSIAGVVGNLGIMMRIDGGVTRYITEPVDYQPFYTVEEAVKLGADAVIVFTFVGTPSETVSLQRLGAAAARADEWGVPLVSEVLAPGLLNNHFDTDVFARKTKKTGTFDETAVVARIAAEAGADIVKTRYNGNVDRFREVVRTCSARVIVAGGPQMNGSDEDLLRLAHDCVLAGAAGIIFGRNVWQHPKMEKMIAALCAIVHEEEIVSRALKLLR